MSVNAKVVIVGCGISGIAAAHRLVNAGFQHVQILEATARSGGRIKTDTLGDNIVEIGAHWIHGPTEENPVFCLARQYGLLDPKTLTPENQGVDVEVSPHQASNFFSSSGRKLNAEDVYPAEEMFYELIYESSKFESQGGEPWACVGDFIRSKAEQRAAEKWKNIDAATRCLRLCVISNMLKVECCFNGAHSMDEVGLGAYGLYKTLPGLDCTFPGDLVTYNRPVRCVHWNNTEKEENALMIECDDEKKMAADHVIVTVPLGYLKKHHSTLFSPPLPLHKLHSVERLGFGTTNVIYVEFDSPWWDADCENIYLVWEDEDGMVDQVPDVQRSWIKKLFGFTVLKPTERYGHVLCGWIAGHESEYMETLSEQEVTHTMTQLIHSTLRLTVCLGNPTVTPRRALRSQWFHDPWTCGSYSYPGKGCSVQDLENMMEPLPTDGSLLQPLQVLFAGEATHTCYFSTVHGALLTGWREADRLISHYSSSINSKPLKSNTDV
ncbi:peroxisomal N(1)-acetyl-spermine/spermidine oxidase-like isoform X2 [Pseudochaenichthys georgianus]|uniref:peroxisomal N(1)-acetyl-spermine/spermidine oxidase-like isoform X2 n=1 Tax=Pseudochaenichthys georgianus TaxID=52239 RepID=UPI00146E76D6|nr:peroxisomal N(1)-acetyl-spermine/spermidine oxidase-like isoform X2 [Pseudochaenichthys georgianus]